MDSNILCPQFDYSVALASCGDSEADPWELGVLDVAQNFVLDSIHDYAAARWPHGLKRHLYLEALLDEHQQGCARFWKKILDSKIRRMLDSAVDHEEQGDHHLPRGETSEQQPIAPAEMSQSLAPETVKYLRTVSSQALSYMRSCGSQPDNRSQTRLLTAHDVPGPSATRHFPYPAHSNIERRRPEVRTSPLKRCISMEEVELSNKKAKIE